MSDQDIILRMMNDRKYWIETFIYVMDEDGRSKTRFSLRKTQEAVIELEEEAQNRGINKLLIPKARRHGITTVEQALSLHKCCFSENAKCATLAHREVDTKSIFNDLALFMYENIEDDFRPQREGHGSTELRLKNMRSSFLFATAGGADPFRGGTLNRCHVSEAAFIENLSEARAALHTATRKGIYVEESTGNGCKGAFYESCIETLDRGEMIRPGMYIGANEYAMLFLPWFLDERNKNSFDYELVPGKPFGDQVQEQVEGELDLINLAMTEYELKISNEQLAWRRKNRADGEQRKLFSQEFPETIMDCFLSTSASRFDNACVYAGRKKCKKALRSEFYACGNLIVWEEPVSTQIYVIGVDVAEGVEGGDYTYITVHKKGGFEQVCAWHGQVSPQSAAEVSAELGLRYNYALIAPERNNHGHAFILALTEIEGYENVYYHADDKIGFHNNKQTRTNMVDDIAEFVNKGYASAIINDEGFWRECPTFERQKSGKYEAKKPNHDDRILAVGIAYQANLAPVVEESWSTNTDGYWI